MIKILITGCTGENKIGTFKITYLDKSTFCLIHNFENIYNWLWDSNMCSCEITRWLSTGNILATAVTLAWRDRFKILLGNVYSCMTWKKETKIFANKISYKTLCKGNFKLRKKDSDLVEAKSDAIPHIGYICYISLYIMKSLSQRKK